MPGVAQAPLSSLEPPGVVGPKLPTPLSDGLIGDGDTSLGEKIFHLSETEAEAVGEPDGMADDCGWKAVTVVGGWCGMYRPCLPNPAQLDKAIPTL